MENKMIITTDELPAVKKFIEYSAQFALNLNMINMTGVGKEIALTLLPGKVLSISIPLDNDEIIFTTDIIQLNGNATRQFSLYVGDLKVLVNNEVALYSQSYRTVKQISQSLEAIISTYLKNNTNLGEVPTQVSLVDPNCGIYPLGGNPYYGGQPQQQHHAYPQYGQPQPSPGRPHFYTQAGYPQQQPYPQAYGSMHNHSNPQQPQQPHGFQPQQPQAGYPMGHGPVGPSCGYAGSAPIKQGYVRDDETGVEGRNARPGG